MKGLDTSMAYVGWFDTFEGQKSTGKEKNVESELIRQLYSLGAIIIAKVSCSIGISSASNLCVDLKVRHRACKVCG